MNKCLYCGNKTKRPKFCCTKHKDKYHNIRNPRGIYAHLKRNSHIEVEDIENEMHPQDPYSLGAE